MPLWTLILIVVSYLLVFLGGMAVGVTGIMYGYRTGFKASYQIRGEPDDSNKSLFGTEQDPAEFAVLAQQEKDEEKQIPNVIRER